MCSLSQLWSHHYPPVYSSSSSSPPPCDSGRERERERGGREEGEGWRKKNREREREGGTEGGREREKLEEKGTKLVSGSLTLLNSTVTSDLRFLKSYIGQIDQLATPITTTLPHSYNPSLSPPLAPPSLSLTSRSRPRFLYVLCLLWAISVPSCGGKRRWITGPRPPLTFPRTTVPPVLQLNLIWTCPGVARLLPHAQTLLRSFSLPTTSRGMIAHARYSKFQIF